MSGVKAEEEVFAANGIAMVGLYRRAVPSTPVRVCDGPGNGRGGTRPHVPNKH